MDVNSLRSINPRELGRRLQDARKARGLTQQDAADHLDVARTTITAIEKGERRIQHWELLRLAVLYGRTIGEFLRQGEPADPFAVQLRAVLAPETPLEPEVEPGTWEFQRLCEDYLELERICGAPLPRKYPEPYQTGGGISPEASAEDVANAERSRLGLGDGPVANLREVLANDVGLRVFYLELPSKVAGMFAYTEQLGGCIAVNRRHPEERRRLSTGHEYGHFLSNRYRPEVTFLRRYHRQPQHERFADAFARAFLMPTTGLSRRYNEVYRSRSGVVTPTDLCILADFYSVSVEALTLRLQELRLLPVGSWDRLQQAGFRVREAQAYLQLPRPATGDDVLPLRYQLLAVEAYEREELSEGQLAHFLRLDRVEVRGLVARLADRATISDEGTVGRLSMDFGGRLSEASDEGGGEG